MGSNVGAVRVFRDEQPVSPILANADEAFGWILGHQSMSVDWAMKYEGYSIRPLTEVQPWPDDEADRVNGRQELRKMAENTFRHEHPRIGSAEWAEWTDGGDADQVALIRDNCHACALEGWGELGPHNSDPERIGPSGLWEPNGAFPRTHIQAGRPIPRRWRAALVWYMNENGNESHRYAILRDLATWGVRFTD